MQRTRSATTTSPPWCAPHPLCLPVQRTRSAITGALKKKLKDLMGEFQDLRSRVQAEYREVVERRVYTGARAAVQPPLLRVPPPPLLLLLLPPRLLLLPPLLVPPLLLRHTSCRCCCCC